MRVYTNNATINISDVVRITFMDATESENVPVAEVVMVLEAMKAFRDGLSNCIEQHEAKMEQIKKAN